MSMLGKAMAIAAVAHQNQTDKGGHAYFLHCIRIMQGLNTKDENVLATAALHDTLEDSEITAEDLQAAGINNTVIEAVLCLTHRKDESYENYIKRIATNPIAIQVKLGDLDDNSDIRRLKGIEPKDFERLQKYNKAFLYLSGIVALQSKIYG